MTFRTNTSGQRMLRKSWSGRIPWWRCFFVVLGVLGTAEAGFLHFEGYSGPIPETVLLQQNGSAFSEVTITAALRAGEDVQSFKLINFNESVQTGYKFDKVLVSESKYSNITIFFEFEASVGRSNYSLEVITTRGTVDTINGSFLIAGITLRNASGDISSGLASTFQAGTYLDYLNGPRTLTVDFVSPDNTAVEDAVRDVGISFSEPSGQQWQEEVQYGPECQSNNVTSDGQLAPGCGVGFTMDGSQFKIRLAPYRVGFSVFYIHLEFTNVIDPESGEVLEGIIAVVLDPGSVPPPVLFSERIAADPYGGEIHPATGFNLGPPSQSEKLTGGSLILASSGSSWDLMVNLTVDAMGPDDPYQIVYFNSQSRPSSSSQSTYECSSTMQFGDKKLASVILDPVTYEAGQISVEFADGALARDNLQKIPSSVFDEGNVSILQFAIEMVQYDPESFSLFKANQACNATLEAVVSTNRTHCAVVDVFEPKLQSRIQPLFGARQNADGVVLIIDAAVNSSEVDTKVKNITDSVRSGRLASMINVDPSTVTLREPPSVLTSSSTPSPSNPSQERDSSTLPGWIIGIIAVAAAVVIVAILGCVLFAMYKTGGEAETESAMSSEGLAVVPRPDDDSYQQAIVRDGFGRGSFIGEYLDGDVDSDAGIPAEYPRMNA